LEVGPLFRLVRALSGRRGRSVTRRCAGEHGVSRGPPHCEGSVSRGLSCISVDRVNRELRGCEIRWKLGDVFAFFLPARLRAPLPRPFPCVGRVGVGCLVRGGVTRTHALCTGGPSGLGRAIEMSFPIP
jgi:hypothetical protein